MDTVSAPPVRHFLIVYQRATGRTEVRRVFPAGQSRAALLARFDLEREYRDLPGTEVAVLGAPSLSELERTHSRYFGGELVISDEAAAELPDEAR